MKRITCAAIVAAVLAVLPLTACTGAGNVSPRPTVSASSVDGPVTPNPQMTPVDAPTRDMPGPSADQFVRMEFRIDPENNGGWTSDSSSLHPIIGGQKYQLRTACTSALTADPTMTPEPARQTSPKKAQVLVMRPDESAPGGSKNVVTLTVTCDAPDQLIPLAGLPAASLDIMLGHIDEGVVYGFAVIERA